MGPPHSEILCGAALPGAFLPEKQVPGVLQPKTGFLVYQQNQRDSARKTRIEKLVRKI